MIRVDPSEQQQRKARALVKALAPLISEHFLTALPPPAPKPVMYPADAEIMKACRAVGEAVDRLQRDRFTPAEFPARKALEKRALALREIMEKRRGR